MKTVYVHLGTHNFRTTVTDGTHQWINDEPADKGGSDTGPEPFATLLGSLGSCTAITLRMYASRKGWDLGEVRVFVKMTLPESGGQKPSVTTEITLTGKLEEAQLLRLQQIARACPVSKLLESGLAIETQVNTNPLCLPATE